MVLTARFPSLTLNFMALNLSFMHIIKVLSQRNTGKMCWVDRLNVVYYDHLGHGMVQAYYKLSTFLIEQVCSKGNSGWCKIRKGVKHTFRSGLGKGRGSRYCEKANDNKGNRLKFLWPKLGLYL